MCPAQMYVVMEFVPRNLLEMLEEVGGGGLDKATVRSTIHQLCTAIGRVPACCPCIYTHS